MSAEQAVEPRAPLELPPSLTASLVLVRHGESTYVAEGRFQGRHDPGLSPLGLRQAELVGRRLAEPQEGTPLPLPAGPPAGVWHSPLRRAAETAGSIARAQPGDVPRHPTAGLTELAQGEWEGLLHSEVHARWPRELAAWRRNPVRAHAPGGEGLGDAAERVTLALRGVIDQLGDPEREDRRATPSADTAGDLAAARRQPVPGYPGATTASEERRAWAVLVAHDGIFRLILMTLLGLPYERFWSFPFNLCAITVVALSEGVAALRAHNLSDHLAPLAAQERAAEEARGDRRGAL